MLKQTRNLPSCISGDRIRAGLCYSAGYQASYVNAVPLKPTISWGAVPPEQRPCARGQRCWTQPHIWNCSQDERNKQTNVAPGSERSLGRSANTE
ncbi:Protein of unknown function [Gryllus bimaculatus]|nr:Protein of unknown function [Gryllus bimaculatus]